MIAPGGIVTGTGLAKAIGDALAAPLPPGSTTTESAMESFANNLAAAIVEHIVANGLISVSVAPGIPVATAGSAVAQTGATTAPGTGTGSIA